MKKDNKVRMAYVGYQKNEENEVDLFVSINRDIYLSLRYLLSFAAEKHEYFSQISDAVHLHDTLTDAWNKAKEMADIYDDDN